MDAQKPDYTYSTIKQFCKLYPAFSVGGIRHNIFQADKNGLKESKAIVRNGRRVLIHAQRFFDWVESR